MGDGLDRTREGLIEVLEMATLTGASALPVSHSGVTGAPRCDLVRADTSPSVASPTGGLAGSFTLINVNTGMDFTLPADALADVASRPYFRPASDSYPALDSAEVDPWSVMVKDGALYRSKWASGREAVSAALLRTAAMGEYTIEPGTLSQSDIVVAFPTWPLYRLASDTGPFRTRVSWHSGCQPPSGPVPGVPIRIDTFNRAQAVRTIPDVPDFGGVLPPGSLGVLCGVTGAIAVGPGDVFGVREPIASVLGGVASPYSFGGIRVPAAYVAGWVELSPTGSWPVMTSLPESTRTELATGRVMPGAHVLRGLPMVGFAARSLRNGSLACSAATCQGHYGGAFPLRYRQSLGMGN